MILSKKSHQWLRRKKLV